MAGQKEDARRTQDTPNAAHYVAHVGIVTIVAIVALTLIFNPPNFSSFGFAVKKPAQCSDGIDNDGDKLIDWPADPDCYGPRDDIEAQDTCSDSDGGFMINTKGTATGIQYGKPYEKQDYCKTVFDKASGTSKTMLIEYFCRAGQPLSNAVDCPTSCTDGACS